MYVYICMYEYIYIYIYIYITFELFQKTQQRLNNENNITVFTEIKHIYSR